MENNIIKRESYRGYIESLEQADVRYTADHWRQIIEAEAADLGTDADVDYIIEWLDKDGFVLEDGKIINQYGEEFFFEATIDSMDDDLREELHAEFAPCTDQTFFDKYAEAHLEKFGEEWIWNTQNPQV